jgi:tetratricopeptide (TPR) repeat protein
MLERFPNSVLLYNIAGAANVGLMQFDAAIASYNKALKINPNYAAVKSNLVELLTSYTPQKQSSNPIVAANESIQKIDMQDITSSVIADDQVVNVFSKSLSCISSSGVEVRTKEDQAYRRNTAPLNCKRHMSIFKKHDVIPKFCFSCYKVQVEPKSIIELIKVFFVLDQLQLNKNNNRKCMIELRPDVPGFYKGLIYCSGLNEANQIAEQLNTILQQSIGPDLCAKVKRGCSEYPPSYPDYKEINNSGPQLMNYNEDWKLVEADYDRENPTRAKENLRSTVAGLNLSDILTIRKWIDYAKGIGDPSVSLLNQNTIYNQKTYELAKARLDQHPFSP